MKTFSIISAAALIAAISQTAFAGEATYDYPQATNAAVAKSRSDVKAEIAQARADGTLQVTEVEWPKLPTFVAQPRSGAVGQPRAGLQSDDGLLALHLEPHSFDGRAQASRGDAVLAVRQFARVN